MSDKSSEAADAPEPTEGDGQAEATEQNHEGQGQAFTQADVDRIVRDRVKRERDKFADYDDLKEAAGEKATLEEKLTAANEAVDAIPSKVSESLRAHLVELHDVDEETADLFLTASEPERLLKQMSALLKHRRPQRSNQVPNEGPNPRPERDDRRAFADFLTGH